MVVEGSIGVVEDVEVTEEDVVGVVEAVVVAAAVALEEHQGMETGFALTALTTTLDGDRSVTGVVQRNQWVLMEVVVVVEWVWRDLEEAEEVSVEEEEETVAVV